MSPPLRAPPDFRLHRRIEVAMRAELQAEAQAQSDEQDGDDIAVTTPDRYAHDLSAFNSPPSLPALQLESSSKFDHSMTKAQYHARRHRHERRKRNRERVQDPTMNRPLKTIAKARPASPIRPGGGVSPGDASAQKGDAGDMCVEADTGDLLEFLRRCGRPLGEPILTAMDLDMAKAKVASTGYVGLQERAGDPTDGLDGLSVEELVERGFRYIEWDGRTSRVFLDATGKFVIGALAGSPADPVYLEKLNEELQEAFDRADQLYQFPKKENRRGTDVHAISCGISFGGGQQRVGNLSHSSRANEEVAKELVALPATRRIANYANAALQMFEPKIYQLYDATLDALCERDPTLVRLFKNNVFGSATFNVGPRTVTDRHRDHLNLAYGACAITAIGRFNPKLGGRLKLYGLRMVVEFPAMSTIIIQSAVLDHANDPIAPGERRHSFTQYSAAGLFRWVDCGFQSKKSLEASGGSLPEDGKDYWMRGINTLTTWEELQAILGGRER